jgi:predicted negative regulator of RcsB-dependent stress response
MQWFSANWRPVVAAVGAVFAVTLLWGVVSLWTGSRAQDSSLALAEAVETFANEGEAAEPMFREVVDRYGRSRQADVALLYLSRIHMDRGEVDQAREILIKLVERNRPDAVGRVAALNLLRLRLAAGQGAEVLKELQAMAAGTDTRLPRDAALFELGTLFLEEHKLDEARQYFEKVVEEFPESPYRTPAMEHLQELG